MNAATDIALVPPKETALQVFQVENGLDPYLAKIRAEIDSFVPDVTTRKGREAIASIAHRVARSKTALDNVGKDLVAELKEIPKKIDAERKRVRDTLDAWKDEVRKPLDDWQAAEDARIDRHQAVIDELNERGAEAGTYDADYLRNSIATVEAVVIGEHLEEFEAEAARAKDKALTALRSALAVREKHAAEQAELAELRRQQAERDAQDERDRIARDAAERATREAEQRAQADRDAAAQRERDALAAAEQSRLNAELAEQRRIAAEQQAALDRQAAAERERQAAQQAERDAQARADAAAAAERQRQADEQARLQREADAREADIAHKTSVLSSIKQSFMRAGITEEQAKAVINMIRKGEVPSVSITY